MDKEFVFFIVLLGGGGFGFLVRLFLWVLAKEKKRAKGLKEAAKKIHGFYLAQLDTIPDHNYLEKAKY